MEPAAIDALGCPELSGLYRLSQQEPLGLRIFAQGCGLTPLSANQMLDRLVAAGVVIHRKGPQGSAALSSISLTPLGRRLAEHVVAMEREMKSRSALD